MRPLPSSPVCGRCTYRLQWHRNLTYRSGGEIKPESPKYVYVPPPVQPPEAKPPPIKGILPIARPLFPKNKEYRASVEYLDRVTTLPKKQKEYRGSDGDRLRYKDRMSAVRRQSLREGISELWARHEASQAKRTKHSEMKRLRADRAAAAPDPPDQILNSTSMHPSVQLMLAIKNLPIRDDRPPSKFLNEQKRLKDRRRAAIHDLYVNAQNFIVNEEQLNAELDKVFGSDEFPIRFNEGNSVWHLPGKPRTAHTMLMEATGQQSIQQQIRPAHAAAQQRLERIAEELTGGKMSDIGKKFFSDVV